MGIEKLFQQSVGDYQSDGLHLHKKKDCRAFAAVPDKESKMRLWGQSVIL